MFNANNPTCPECDAIVITTGHADNCPSLRRESGVVAARTSQIDPIGIWRGRKVVRRRPSAVVKYKLRKNGVDIDQRFKPVIE